MKKQTLVLVFVLALLFTFSYDFLDTKLEGFLIESNTIFIDSVIDGDTIKSNGTSIRLLGINTPERGEKYSLEAKQFLEGLVLNKSVTLVHGKDKTDLYGRTLAYVFINDKNVNSKIIENGYANFYFPSGKDSYYNDFKNSWEICVESNLNLCEKSKNTCGNCISLKELDYQKEEVVLENLCSLKCDLSGWEIKDEGRKKFAFDDFVLGENKEVKIVVGEGENSRSILFWNNEKYVWTDSGDTIFLRDPEGKLVFWKSY